MLAAASADEQTPADLGSLRMHIVRPTSGGVHFFEAVPRHEETGTVLLEGGALEALGKLPLKESLGAIGHDCTIVAWNGKDVGGFKVVPGEAGQAISLQCSYVKPDASGAPDSTPFELTLSRSATLTELRQRAKELVSAVNVVDDAVFLGQAGDPRARVVRDQPMIGKTQKIRGQRLGARVDHRAVRRRA